MLRSASIIYFILSIITLVIIIGCNKHPEQEIEEAVLKTEDYFNQSKGIDCVGAFKGDTVKFRLLLEVEPTVEEARKLFSEVLSTIRELSNSEETWNYYNADFDIVYKDTIIFEGVKESGSELRIKTK
ncbi:hypothetical protein M3172_16140 [Mesobacillus subterraneus]|uniref:hypothetical protein n=1 Tax=Mesobacillus subterraneus TaxID=285983 RepID=UPI00203D48D8|nr:hypothetical protein [Mesobacillus subterraneus]MCM3574728.1 hypothetical protein [Mesobacillus subterraneus]